MTYCYQFKCSSIRLVQVSSNAFIWLQEIQTFCTNTSPWESNGVDVSRKSEMIMWLTRSKRSSAIFIEITEVLPSWLGSCMMAQLICLLSGRSIDKSRTRQRNELMRLWWPVKSDLHFRPAVSFQGFQSYRDFGNILKEKNLEVERRFVNRCELHPSDLNKLSRWRQPFRKQVLSVISSSSHAKRADSEREGLPARALLTRRKFLFYTESRLLVVATCFYYKQI